jgi:hypothetical protein
MTPSMRFGQFETIDCYHGAGQAEGIASGTQIATNNGWRPVDAIAVGDWVMTFDHGLRRVAAVKRAALRAGQGNCPKSLRLLAVPEGVLGNEFPMLLLPEQNVMIESDLAEAVFGDAFAIIPAASLEGYRGISRVDPHQTMDVIQLVFAQDEIIYANGMGLIHCGSIDCGRIDRMLDAPSNYAILPLDMARVLVAAMVQNEAVKCYFSNVY